jgi:aspartyl protease family protein
MRPSLALALALGLALLAAGAQAQSVALAGRMGERALLIVNGQPHTLAVGASAGGVKLLRWAGEQAEVDTASGRLLLRVGGTPAQIGAAAPTAAAREIVMSVGPGGHFTPQGAINGRPVRFMVDTGATLVALGRAEAERLGLDLANAQQGVTQTANGPVRVHVVVLDRVRVGEVEITNVGAVVTPQGMPYVLLGNSFLGRFQMQRVNDVMRLQLK